MAKADSHTEQEVVKKTGAELHILLSDVLLSYSNSAAEFVDVLEDELQLKINLQDDQGDIIQELDQRLKGSINKGAGKTDDRIKLKNDFEAVVIEIETDQMMKAWMGDVSLEIENKRSSYIKYRVISAKANLQWFEMQNDRDFKQFLSEITKTVKPVDNNDVQDYSLREVEICGEMLAKAIRKIDLRTGGAMVKFNTDHGRLEPVLQTLAHHLGYVLTKLSPEEIYDLHQQDINASHSIRLRN